MRSDDSCVRLARMSGPGAGTAPLVERLRRAIEQRDVGAFGALLADDARWGDDDEPNRCRSRADVVETLVRGVTAGGSAEIEDLVAGDRAVPCALRVRWPDGEGRALGVPGEPGGRRLFHVYRVEDGLIAQILAFEDRRSAAAAARLTG